MEEEKIKYLCAKYDIHPSKKRGQNFLIDPRITQIILDSADLKADDYVIEVGPGLGVLTRELVKKVKQVVAVEIDDKMARALKELFPLPGNGRSVAWQREQGLSILNRDILEIKTGTLFADRQKVFPFKVVANLPYSITSAVLRKFTEPTLRGQTPEGGQTPQCDWRPSIIVVMVQKEVAERVCAKPGEMSILSVAIQYYGKPEIIKIVPRNAFWPEPEVDSAILRITLSQSPPYLKGEKVEVDEKRLFKLVRMGFSSRRKQLQNNLSAGLHLPRAQTTRLIAQIGLNPKIRAQELSVGDWIALSRVV